MNTADHEIRRVILRPYRKGCGPSFTLQLFETGRRSEYGHCLVGYRLAMTENGKRTVLFEGDDYGCSPMHCFDSDESVSGLMGFLTCRPGDVEPNFFVGYTDKQLDFCQRHAEWLSLESGNRFGE